MYRKRTFWGLIDEATEPAIVGRVKSDIDDVGMRHQNGTVPLQHGENSI